MTATDELRRLLEERGVEYETYIEQPTGFEHVKWNFNRHGSADFNLEFGEPWLTMYGTISGPEQAIDATLGNDGVERSNDGVAELRAENAKLRELVRFIMRQCNDGNSRCDECVGWNGGECVALLRMRELGVEVDDGNH